MDNTALPPGLTRFGINSRDVFDDFLWGAVSADGPTSITSTVKNGGIAAHESSAPTDNSYIGKLDLSTGTSSNATGKAIYWSSGNGNIGSYRVKGGGYITLEWRVRIPTLSVTSVSFNAKIGLQDGNNGTLGDPANGIYFHYSETINSGKWRAVTRNASTGSTLDSSITVVASTWYKLSIQVNNAGTNAEFFIDGVSIGNLTTNIPTTNPVSLLASIEKQGSSSSTSRSLNLDWVYLRTSRT